MDLEKKELYISRISRLQKLAAYVLALVLTFAMLTVNAFASSDAITGTISSAIGSGMKSIYGLITSIILPIAAVIFAFAGLKMLIGGQRDIEAGQGKLLMILVVLIIVFFAPLIIEAMGSWFKGASDSSSVWTN